MGMTVVILTVVGALLLCGVVAWVVMAKLKADAYRGVVADKGSQEVSGANDSTATSYFLTVALEDGNHKRVRVGKKIWEQFAIGDSIVKEAGKYNPARA